jgi:acyl carrier protein
MSPIPEIRTFIVDNFLYGKDDDFGDDVSFLEKGIIDSTGVLELVSFVEDKFGITVEDEELIPENFDSVSNLASYISKKINNGN